LHQQGIDTTTPTGKAMSKMCGLFAEFERSMIRERVNAGLAKARANGKQLGRPSVDPHVEKSIRLALKRSNKGIRKIVRELGVGVSVV
jgi:DNA invertase Pin-like site-specific DNA recombinase